MWHVIEFYRANYYQRKGQKLLVNGKPEKAYPYFEKALMLDDNPANIYNLALALLAMKRFDEAEKYLQKLLDLQPGNELGTLTLSEIYTWQREWDKAQALLNKLVELHPSNKNYHKYLQRITDPQARERYIKAKELLSESQTLLEKKEINKALQTLLEAEQYDPENPYIQNNLGSFYLLLEKNPKKALTYFQKAYQLEPGNAKFRQNLFQVRKQIRQ